MAANPKAGYSFPVSGTGLAWKARSPLVGTGQAEAFKLHSCGCGREARVEERRRFTPQERQALVSRTRIRWVGLLFGVAALALGGCGTMSAPKSLSALLRMDEPLEATGR